MIVVTDTSVVLNLCCLHCEKLLPELFGSVIAPPAVHTEFQRLVAVDSRFADLAFPSFIQLTAPTQIAPALSQNHRLHAGELEALSLALELQADAIVMDERAGRAAAAEIGMRSIGVLGILIQAKAVGLISSVRPRLDLLHSRARFWIAPSLRRKVLTMVGE